jgi:choline monooxygenase
MLNVYLGQRQTNVVIPMGHDRCCVVFGWYATNLPPMPPPIRRGRS